MHCQHTRACAGAPNDADYAPAMHREMSAVAAYLSAGHCPFRSSEALCELLEQEAPPEPRNRPRPPLTKEAKP